MQEPLKKTNSSVVYYENSSLFVNNHGAFIFKKIEKIVTALYMITEFFSTKEPLKWNIRSVSNEIVKDTLILTRKSGPDTSKTLKEVHRRLLEVSSYLYLGHATGLISNMNFTILNNEIEKVSHDIEGEIKRHPDIKENIRQDFFETEQVQDRVNKGHTPSVKDIVKDNNKPEAITGGTSKKSYNQEDYSSKDKASGVSNESRRTKILDVIREKGRVSIKDIVYQIPKCSSKTIQRDLVKLIDEGLVLKEGDRRWSIYFLKP